MQSKQNNVTQTSKHAHMDKQCCKQLNSKCLQKTEKKNIKYIYKYKHKTQRMQNTKGFHKATKLRIC